MPDDARPRGAHTFVLRIRVQPREIEGTVPVWYGTIEHIPSGTSRAVKTLEEVDAFILRNLEQ